MTAKEYLQSKYPQMAGEKWNSNPHIDDDWVAGMMAEYAEKKNPELLPIPSFELKDDLTKEEIEQLFKEFYNQPLQFVRHIDKHVDLVLAELSRAEALHSWEGNSIIKNALILSEEAGEVSKAVLQYEDEGGSIEAVKLELIQTCAMCFRMLKNLPE